jgi:hypothetical protein
MGLAYGILWNGSVHQALGSFINLLYGERDKGGSAPPLSIPAAPRGNRCCALRSPPACLTAAGSTRLTRSMLERVPVSVRLCPPSMASRPCHSRFGSPISAGTQPPRCHIADKSKVGIADTLPDGAGAYPAYAVPAAAGSVLVGRIRRSRHPAIGAAGRMPDGAHAYPAYAVSAAP